MGHTEKEQKSARILEVLAAISFELLNIGAVLFFVYSEHVVALVGCYALVLGTPVVFRSRFSPKLAPIHFDRWLVLRGMVITPGLVLLFGYVSIAHAIAWGALYIGSHFLLEQPAPRRIGLTQRIQERQRSRNAARSSPEGPPPPS